MNRRQLVIALAASTLTPARAIAATRTIWGADTAAAALNAGEIVLVDIRSRPEWAETGVAKGAWVVSMHERGFEGRLFAARALADEKPIALICATGGRSARLLRALNRAGYDDFIDISEGMMGSRAGPGWIARGFPIIDLQTALNELPDVLR